MTADMVGGAPPSSRIRQHPGRPSCGASISTNPLQIQVKSNNGTLAKAGNAPKANAAYTMEAQVVFKFSVTERRPSVRSFVYTGRPLRPAPAGAGVPMVLVVPVRWLFAGRVCGRANVPRWNIQSFYPGAQHPKFSTSSFCPTCPPPREISGERYRSV